MISQTRGRNQSPTLFLTFWKAGSLPGPRQPLLLATLAVLSLTWQTRVPGAAPGDPCLGISVVAAAGAADLAVDPRDYPVVQVAAKLFADDVCAVTGQRPMICADRPHSREVIVIGTLGHSTCVDQLAAAGKLARLGAVAGHWETTLLQVVENPWPGVERALVVAGSDRRGTAYGVMELSRRIGVSPWSWWADVPIARQPSLTLTCAAPEIQSPAVKYRGIFINDEDWGLEPWAAQTFDPSFKNIGPKTYEMIFELMLRLKLNYLWPAMHPCSTEFASVPENAVLADRYAIVMGASHCEPMLQNNVWWPHDQGPWRYDTNRDHIRGYWATSAKARGNFEAVWTLGLRGIHDAPLEGPPDVPGRLALVQDAIKDQRQLIERSVTHKWGAVAECFVPYKEVLPLYDAGLEVPPDVTLVWADDNYGYIRRLSNPTERQRPGGSGVYYHLSYMGGMQSYLWIDTTPPALLWEELRKAWDNDARTLWIINVGDIKPAEMGISFFAGLAWDPAAMGADAQPRFLRDFAARTFGPARADTIADLCTEFYRLGQVRKPELMTQAWMDNQSAKQVTQLAHDYLALLEREKALRASLPPNSQNAWIELAGYPARMLAASGLVFIEDRLARAGSNAATHAAAVGHWRDYINRETDAYNERVAGGKWRHMMMSGDSQGREPAWAEVRWPWNRSEVVLKNPRPEVAETLAGPARMVPAAASDRHQDQPGARWTVIAGLGHSGQAVSLEPAVPQNSWAPESSNAPTLEFDFENTYLGTEAVVYLLPTFRLYPGMKLRLAVGVDAAPAAVYEVPGADGAEDENGLVRRDAVRNNRVSVRVTLAQLAPGKHTLKIQAVDPGVVLDEIALPR